MRESRLACSRVKRRARAAVSVAPLRETPGHQRGRLGDPEREPVGGAGVARAALLRARVGGEHRGRPGDEPGGDRPRAAEPRLDLPLERVADERRRNERERDDRGPPARRRRRSSAAISRRWPISSAAAVPACSATSKLLRASGSISPQPQPASRGTSERCAELETGSSSVGPWTAPSAPPRARGSGRGCVVPASADGLVSAGLGGAAPAHDQVDDADARSRRSTA